MNTILFDGPERTGLLPFTFTRPVADMRLGILTFREKWEQFLGVKTSTQTQDYLSKKYPIRLETENLFINPAYQPDENLVKSIENLSMGEKLVYKGGVIAYKSEGDQTPEKDIEYQEDVMHIEYSYNLIAQNAEAIKRDFDLVTKGRKSEAIPATVVVKNPEHIFIEPGAKLFNCSLNAEDGPIYIGKNAEVMEGALVRGPFALCESSLIKMGAKIYGDTTIGPHSKMGGEVAETIVIGYSNKAHEGFLGNSVMGEWCNIGADSNNSDLKNNYAQVKLWSYDTERFEPTGMQFCGLMMGDHSKCGINTMFNTGTVVGVSANVFGAGFPRNFIPSFSWGGASKMITYRADKVFEVAEKVMARRKIAFTEEDRNILQEVFEQTSKYRRE